MISAITPPSLSLHFIFSHRYLRSGSPAYQQVWLRGDPEGPTAHVHEGVQLADKSGWVAIGELLPGENQTPEVFKVGERQYWRKLRFPEQAIIRAVDNEAATKWTQIIGEANQDPANSSYTVGFSVIQVSQSLSLTEEPRQRFLSISVENSNYSASTLISLREQGRKGPTVAKDKRF